MAPVRSISIIKLLRAGFELFTWLGGGEAEHTEHIFVFTGGAEGASAVGTALANPRRVRLGPEGDY